MSTFADKIARFPETTHRPERKQASGSAGVQRIAPSCARVSQLRTLQDAITQSPRVQGMSRLRDALHDTGPLQRKSAAPLAQENQTGLPDALKTGIEHFSSRTEAFPVSHGGPVQLKISVQARKLSGMPGRRYRRVTEINNSDELKEFLDTRMGTPLNSEQALALFGQLDGQTLRERELLNQAYALLHPPVATAGIEQLLLEGDQLARTLERNTVIVESVGRSTFVDGSDEVVGFLEANFDALTQGVDSIGNAQIAGRRNRMVSRAIQALFRAANVIKENVDILIEAGYLDPGDPQFRRAQLEARTIADRYAPALPSVDRAIRAPRPGQPE